MSIGSSSSVPMSRADYDSGLVTAFVERMRRWGMGIGWCCIPSSDAADPEAVEGPTSISPASSGNHLEAVRSSAQLQLPYATGAAGPFQSYGAHRHRPGPAAILDLNWPGRAANMIVISPSARPLDGASLFPTAGSSGSYLPAGVPGAMALRA